MNNNKNEKPENNLRMKRTYSIGIKDDEVKVEKTLLEKMTSFLGSMYYNVSKITIFVVGITGVGVLVTNYNVFPVLEKIFVKEDGTQKAKETLIETKGLDFNKDIVTEEEFRNIHSRITSEVSSVILEKSLFDEGQEAFNEKMKLFYTQGYIEKTVTDDVLYNVLENIYKYNHRYPYSVSITSIGKVMKNDKPVTKVVVDINGVDDDMGFHVSSVAMFLNSKYEIQDMKTIFENKEYVNTRTPLDIEHSLIKNSTANIMTREVNKFLKEFNNKSLYDKIQISSMDINNSQLKSFFSNLDIEQKDYDALSELFNLIKGNSRNLAIVEYMQTDFDAVPYTSIILGVKTTEKTYKYNLQFDRGEEKLISISKI